MLCDICSACVVKLTVFLASQLLTLAIVLLILATVLLTLATVLLILATVLLIFATVLLMLATVYTVGVFQCSVLPFWRLCVQFSYIGDYVGPDKEIAA